MQAKRALLAAVVCLTPGAPSFGGFEGWGVVAGGVNPPHQQAVRGAAR